MTVRTMPSLNSTSWFGWANDVDAAARTVEEPGYDLILGIGQSNMRGPDTSDLVRQDVVDPRIFQYGTAGLVVDQISAAVPPLQHADAAVASPRGVSPDFVFARWYSLLHPNRRVLIVPVAYGGTTFGNNTNVLRWKTTTTPVENNLYEKTLTQTAKALAAAGPGSRVVAATWVHGETDGTNGLAGTTYATELDALITGLRDRLGAPSLPFIIGQMVPEYLPSGTRDAINVATHGATARLANVGFGFGPFVLNQGDANHYTAPGIRNLGDSMWAAYRRVTTGVDQPALPARPADITNLLATVASSTSINLTWDAVLGAGSYFVERKLTSANSSSWGRVATPNTNTYGQTGLTADTSYDYRVRAVSQGGGGNVSAAVTVIPTAGADVTKPTAPASLTATSGSSQVALAWPASTDNVAVTGYRVYRGGTLLTTVTGLAYTDTTAINGSTYSYVVRAIDAAGNESDPSPTATGAPAAVSDTTAPTVPGTPTATAGTQSATATTSGSTDAVGVTAYRWYRGGNQVGSTSGTSFTETGLPAGTPVSYTVAAIDAAGNLSAQSAASNSVTPIAAPSSNTFVSDTYTDTAGTNLVAHTGEVGATYTAHPEVTGGNATITDAGRVRCGTTTGVVIFASGTPSSANQVIDFDVYCAGSPGSTSLGVAWRGTLSARTYYALRYIGASSGWRLDRIVANSSSTIGAVVAQTLTPGSTYHIKITHTGNRIVATIDGAPLYDYTDASPITTAGLLGFMAAGAATNTTALHLDNLVGVTQ